MAFRASIDDRRLRPPPIQTTVQRPSTAPHSGTPSSSRNPRSPRLEGTPEEKLSINDAAKPGQHRFVMADPVAFRYLEQDPSTVVLARQEELHGYECYIIEQWTTSRTHPTFVITTYTGDPAHVVMVGVLSLPTDQTTWSPRLRVYFKALNQYHARRRETPLGTLMVTNLTGFPSSLTVIPIPNGDLHKHRSDFYVNENLKRLGCSGRVGLTLAPPLGATIAKFHQLYRISDKIDVYRSVTELVKLCQAALMLFDKLEIDYADGLLCDVTERAVNDWWIEIANDQYNVMPHDGILGPTTVAGLLGLLMGARNRLHAVGAPVSKDPFDVEAMKRGIGHFQKQQRMTRSRRLDRRTLEKLQKATQKAADHEGWTMPKMLKSTAAEWSGKGGDMAMDAVGRRDRAGIAEIETCDIERFAQLVYGDRCKWLWLGKSPKKTFDHTSDKAQAREGNGLYRGMTFRQDDHGGFTWTARKSTVDAMPSSQVPDDVGTPAAEDDVSSSDGDARVRTGVFKKASDFKHEAKSGLGKFKGVVALRGHHHKPSVDESPTTPVDDGTKRRPFFSRSLSSPDGSPKNPSNAIQDTNDSGLDATIADKQKKSGTDPEEMRAAANYMAMPNSAGASKEDLEPTPYAANDNSSVVDSGEKSDREEPSQSPPETLPAEPSVAGSIYNGVELNEVLPVGPETEKSVDHLLQRTLSFSHFVSIHLEHRPDDGYPRHLSFSLAEDSVLGWDSILDEEENDAFQRSQEDITATLANEEAQAREAKSLRAAISTLNTSTADWTQTQLQLLHSLLEQADRDAATLNDTYAPYQERIAELGIHSEGVLRDQRERLGEDGKEIETLAAKLDYEISELKGRVEDVTAGVGDLGKGVRRVEERVEELEKAGQRGGRWGCVVS